MKRLEDSSAEVTPRDLVASLALRTRAPLDGPAGPRPRVTAAMIASADGRSTIDGRSVALGHPEDRALLRELRTGTDAILVGSGTLIAERYRNLLDPEQRAHRAAAGLPEHPVLATVSRDLRLRAGDVPIFSEAGVPIAVYAERGVGIAGAAADVQVRVLGTGRLTFPAILADLHRRYGVRAVCCEGGPVLLRELAAQHCLDELLLTLSPRLVAGAGPTPLTGPELPGAPRLRLRAVHRAGDHLFLRYAPEGAA